MDTGVNIRNCALTKANIDKVPLETKTPNASMTLTADTNEWLNNVGYNSLFT